MDRKLAMFPMNRNQCAMARHASLLQGYHFSSFLMPSYKHPLNGVDISCLDGGDAVGAVLTAYSKEALQQSDVLFIAYDDVIKDMAVYFEVLNDATQLGIEIITTRQLADKLGKAPTPPEACALTRAETETDKLLEIETPVISVFAQGMRTDQLAVELSLREFFLGLGYKVSQVGACEAGQFFGFPCMPQFMHEPSDAYHKILDFNTHVKDIEEREQPEVMILGVPGAIMKFGDRDLQGLGILPFIVANAVPSDEAILCTYYAKYEDAYYEELDHFFQYRLGCHLRFINIANTSTLPDLTTAGAKTSIFDVSSEFVMPYINAVHGDYTVSNVLSRGSSQKMCQGIQVALTNNTLRM